MFNFDRTIAIIAALASVISAAAAILACRLQLRKPRRIAIFGFEADRPGTTVTITNVGDVTIPISRILLDFNGDGVTVKCPTVEHTSSKDLLKNLKRWTAVKIMFSAPREDEKAINIKTRLIIELTDGTRLLCKRCVLG